MVHHFQDEHGVIINGDVVIHGDFLSRLMTGKYATVTMCVFNYLVPLQCVINYRVYQSRLTYIRQFWWLCDRSTKRICKQYELQPTARKIPFIFQNGLRCEELGFLGRAFICIFEILQECQPALSLFDIDLLIQILLTTSKDGVRWRARF